MMTMAVGGSGTTGSRVMVMYYGFSEQRVPTLGLQQRFPNSNDGYEFGTKTPTTTVEKMTMAWQWDSLPRVKSREGPQDPTLRRIRLWTTLVSLDAGNWDTGKQVSSLNHSNAKRQLSVCQDGLPSCLTAMVKAINSEW